MSTSLDLIYDSSTIYAQGLLQGASLQIDPTSLLPLSHDGQVLRGRLRSSLSKQHAHGGEMGWVCIKKVEEGSGRAPRNVKREIELLQSMRHDNILPLLGAHLLRTSPYVPSLTYHLLTPSYPLNLATVLDSPLLSPSNPEFDLLVHSLSRQLISAVAYLHALSPPVAHRDIGRNNVVIGREGRVILVDFGVSVREGDEPAGQQAFDFGTQPYKPPELIFASRTYSPPALDLWALACLLAEFFTPLSLPLSSTPSSLGSDERRWKEAMSDGEDDPPDEGKSTRETLFDGSKTDFALTGSIFKLLGTPTAVSWPESAQCPSFAHFRFASFPPQGLVSRLPNIANSSTPLLLIIEGLLRISASARLSAEECLADESWEGVGVLKPVDLGGKTAAGGGEGVDGRTLGELLQRVLEF